MKIYAAHGCTDFVICLGYKGYVIKEYFANYFLHMAARTRSCIPRTRPTRRTSAPDILAVLYSGVLRVDRSAPGGGAGHGEPVVPRNIAEVTCRQRRGSCPASCSG